MAYGYITRLNENVAREHVRYSNRYGIAIAADLLAAGCGEAEIEMILSSIQNGDRKNTEKLIAKCRKKQLDRLHDSQTCIDRLDYLSYQLGRDKELKV